MTLPALDQPAGALPARDAPLTFAVLGDVHGHHAEAIEVLDRAAGAFPPASGSASRLDFILQTGDFEPIRNAGDLASIAGPAKYRVPGDFARVLAGDIRYPAPVLFIGGNHEPYAFLESLSDGAAVADGIRFLGRAGEASIEGLRVAYLGGIFSPTYFDDPDARRRIEWPEPIEKRRKIPTYFTREEIEKLDRVAAADILIAHEWPAQMIRLAEYGDPPSPRQRETARRFVAAGSRHVRDAIERIEPAYIFCGHMHASLFGARRGSEGRITRIACLDQVAGPGACVAIVRIEPDGSARGAAYTREGTPEAGN